MNANTSKEKNYNIKKVNDFTYSIEIYGEYKLPLYKTINNLLKSSFFSDETKTIIFSAEKIETLKPAAIILDPITNLMTEAPNSDVRGMLTRFIDYLKTKEITVMFTAAITVGSIAHNPSDEGISSMVDTWIMLRDVEKENERAIEMYIMKSRGMRHSKEKNEMKITEQGVVFTEFKKQLNVATHLQLDGRKSTA
jgi:KaiC/GvpD/RAD55 family RecA-like ATPase